MKKKGGNGKILKLNYLHYNNLGVFFKNRGLYTRAIEEYEKAISLNPNFDNGYYNLGSAYYEIGKFDEALKKWKRGLMINKKNNLIIQSLKRLMPLLKVSAKN